MGMEHGVTAADVQAAYRIILGREIDAGADQAWHARLAKEVVPFEALRNELMRADEYRSKFVEQWTDVDVGGVRVVVDAFEPEFGRFIVEHKMWEPHIVDLITGLLHPGGIFVDIGANVGLMSFHAAKAIGDTGRVIAFEPKPENVQAFLRGVLANNFKNIVLYPFGASSAHGLFALEGSSNAFLVDAHVGSTLAQCFVADLILDREARVDVIKIDIEGHEPFAIEGLRGTIAKHRPLIVCEFNPRCLKDHIGQDPTQFAKTLFDLANKIEVIHHDGTVEMRFDPTSADQLMRLWDAHNQMAVKSGRLEDGLLHFDLLISTL